MTILYISGYGRSGSTVLDSLLGAQNGVIGGGELAHVFRMAADKDHCSCGAEFMDCQLWGPALRATTLSTGLTLQQLTDLNARFNARRWARRRAERHLVATIWRLFFKAVFDITGAQLIVDSSKSGRLMNSRLPLLARDARIPTRAIHLVRDPMAVLSSLQRGSNRALEHGHSEGRRMSNLSGVARWSIGNARAEISLCFARVAYMRLRYEDLLENPEAEVERVLGFAGVELTTAPKLELAPGHGVAGNRMRRQISTHFAGLIKGSERMTEVPRWAGPLRRWYGYGERRNHMSSLT